MHLAITIWAVLAAWRWGKWENFHKYHATMIYLSTMDLLYFYLTIDYPLWRLQPDLGMSDGLIQILYTFIIFPCTVIIFLSRYPNVFSKQCLYIGKWIVIYIGVEGIGWIFGRINYAHGWNLGASFLFLFLMFPMLRLHYKKPIVAYVVSIIVITSLLFLFGIPLHKEEGL
ncbi:CBO0543 family protein [Halobacillus seohaensis]|uniref:CBO0543 family protein n=1 Tax=Halobacillus seohaensis TaxID=447421 RepID=A0ABW2EL70_9BACI